jgi:FMN-dependent NADH-azoreductase
MSEREQLDVILETKLRENLKWSMLFFVFNFVTAKLEDKNSKANNLKTKFFKNWKKHSTNSLVKRDLEAINSILNSPKNIFHSTLQNSGETIESTEIYQEKYNNLFKKIEEFYIENTSEIKNNDD